MNEKNEVKEVCFRNKYNLDLLIADANARKRTPSSKIMQGCKITWKFKMFLQSWVNILFLHFNKDLICNCVKIFNL